MLLAAATATASKPASARWARMLRRPLLAKLRKRQPLFLVRVVDDGHLLAEHHRRQAVWLERWPVRHVGVIGVTRARERGPRGAHDVPELVARLPRARHRG